MCPPRTRQPPSKRVTDLPAILAPQRVFIKRGDLCNQGLLACSQEDGKLRPPHGSHHCQYQGHGHLEVPAWRHVAGLLSPYPPDCQPTTISMPAPHPTHQVAQFLTLDRSQLWYYSIASRMLWGRNVIDPFLVTSLRDVLRDRSPAGIIQGASWLRA